MSIKITKKNLKELGKSLGGYYCGGNVYTHENIEYYITHNDYKKVFSAAPNNEKMVELANMIYDYVKMNEDVKRFGERVYITSNLIAYSAGYNGNIGQIFKYDVVNDSKVIKTFYTYYC